MKTEELRPALSAKDKNKLYNANVLYLAFELIFFGGFLFLPIFTYIEDPAVSTETAGVKSILFYAINRLTTLIPTISSDVVTFLKSEGLFFFVVFLTALFFIFTFITFLKVLIKGFNKEKKVETIEKEFYGTKKEIRKAKRLNNKNNGWNFILFLYTAFIALIPLLGSLKDLIPAEFVEYVYYVFYSCSNGFVSTGVLGFMQYLLLLLGVLCMLMKRFRKKAHKQHAKLIVKEK